MKNSQTQLIELRVIGGMLIDSTFISTVPVKTDDFVIASLRQIHTAMLEMVTQGKTVDLVTVAEHLEKKTGNGFLNVLERAYEAAQIGVSNTPALGDALRDHSKQRKGREIGQQLVETGDVDAAMHDLMNINTESLRHSYHLTEAVQNFYDEVERGDKGITTGLTDLDRLLGGFRNGDLYVFGARPAMGKTALMLNLSLKSGVPCGIISAEQGHIQIAGRAMAIMSRTNAWGLRNRELSPASWARVTEATGKLEERKYFIYDKAAPTIMDVVREARAWKPKHGIRILFVDYLQRLQATSKSIPRHEQIAEVAMGLKEIARDLDIPVVAMAQVNRGVENRDCKRPGMADLKDSGAIEQESDVVVMLYRDQVYHPDTNDVGVAELNIEKNRHGPGGTIRVAWLEQSMRFEDLSTRGET
ncbi:MAG: hypothetical protein B6D75_08745 [gamma proteobacterium symbiont of Stewartia floridana]|nr:MAG: hypothetical protein B6D75_08745 [gamma proteobacterium symbiont of Stewartia floridana]